MVSVLQRDGDRLHGTLSAPLCLDLGCQETARRDPEGEKRERKPAFEPTSSEDPETHRTPQILCSTYDSGTEGPSDCFRGVSSLKTCVCVLISIVLQWLSLSLTLYNPMDCSMPGFPIHYLPEFAQIHVR